MFVSAGDLEKYAFCPLSWWLSKRKKVVEKEGIKHHRKMEEELNIIKEGERRARFYEKYVLFFALSASIIALFGISFMYGGLEKFWKYFLAVIALLWLLNAIFFLYRESRVERILKKRYEKPMLISSIGAIIISTTILILSSPIDTKWSIFAEILALIWVIMANIFFYRYVVLSDDILLKKMKYAPLRGEINYIGKNVRGGEITSEKYGIRGTPDYIIKIDDEYIPVEEKSSDVSHPLFHHVMQVTAYCMLVEDKYGAPPPYGILKYRNAQFKIPYEERWKRIVLNMKEQMLKDIEKGEAHRNHSNARKCRRCHYREECPESMA